MYFLFILTGILLGAIIPAFNFDFLGWKGAAYYWIMLAFAIVVLGFMILSVYKSKISKYDYLAATTIVSWDTPRNKKVFPRYAYYISLLSGIVLGIVLIFNAVNFINSILLSLSCAFIVLGIWQLGFLRLNQKIESIDSFLLSHMGIIYNGKIEVFNGYSKGILSAKEENNTLYLNVLRGKQEETLEFKIPDDKLQAVRDFLEDLNKFFAGNENVEE